MEGPGPLEDVGSRRRLAPPDGTEFTIETPSKDKQELERYLGEAVWQSLRDADLLAPDLP